MIAARADRAAARRRARRRSSPAEPHVALLCGRYEGFDERVHRAPRRRDGLDRPLRARRRRAGGDGRRRRGAAQAAGRARARATARSRSPSAQALEGAPEYPHYTRPPSYRGWEVPRSCSPATTSGSATGGWSRAAAASVSSSNAPREYATIPARTARRPSSGSARLFLAAMSTVIESIERASCGGSPVLRRGRPRARPLPGRSRAPAAAPRSSRASSSSARAAARARPSPSASSPSASASSGRSRCTRRRSSSSRSPPAATCAGRSSTTCAAGSASAPGSPSGAGASTRS